MEPQRKRTNKQKKSSTQNKMGKKTKQNDAEKKTIIRMELREQPESERKKNYICLKKEVANAQTTCDNKQEFGVQI